MAENYGLWQVKIGFTDKYTKCHYKSGVVAVFERERAKEILATLGENALIEVELPEGFYLAAERAPAEVVNETANEEISAAEEQTVKRGRSGKK